MNTLRASETLSRLTALRSPRSLAPTWFTTTTTATRSRCTPWMKSFSKNTSNAKCECLTSFLSVFSSVQLAAVHFCKRLVLLRISERSYNWRFWFTLSDQHVLFFTFTTILLFGVYIVNFHLIPECTYAKSWSRKDGMMNWHRSCSCFQLSLYK